jgi:transposase
MRETITLNSREQKRLFVLNRVDKGQLVAAQAAQLLDLSVRQLRRILAAYRKEGAAALAHGNRGRKPVHATSAQVRQQIIELASSKYQGCNHQHLSELLEPEGIRASRSTIRRILGAVGLKSPRKRRPPKHRRRRERYPQEGMLLQIDGSPHPWLEDRGPRLTLIAAIDDATGKVVGGLFREQEDAQGYFLLLQQIVSKQGRPLALYHDRHGIFQRGPKEPETLAEQLTGKREPTQFGRLLEELEITSISAHSPQAKGRIERLFGTFQDRLVVELRLAQAKTVEEANRVLEGFLPRYNKRFAVPALEPGLAYRPLFKGLRLQEVFCFKYQRTVGADNTVKLGEHRLQLEPSAQRDSYAHLRVEVHERLDGSLAVYYERKRVGSQEAPKEAPALRARQGGRGPLKPAGVAGGDSLGSEHGRQADRSGKIEGARQGTAVRSSIPRPDHPWRKPYKRPMVTKSLNA